MSEAGNENTFSNEQLQCESPNTRDYPQFPNEKSHQRFYQRKN